MIKTILLVGLVVFSSFVQAQVSPRLCVNSSSDPDGDGYGWENGESCLMPTSSPVIINNSNALSACLADGNALDAEIARLRSQLANLQPVSSGSLTCEDTAPVGDGWGWDGTSSCRVQETESATMLGDYNESSLTCVEAARRIRDFVEIGMSQAAVRALLGKPPAVISNTWYYNDGATAWPAVQFDQTLRVSSSIGTDIQCGLFD